MSPSKSGIQPQKNVMRYVVDERLIGSWQWSNTLVCLRRDLLVYHHIPYENGAPFLAQPHFSLWICHAAMRRSIFPKLCHESEWLSWNQQPSRFGFRVLGACDVRLAQIASGKHTKSAIEHGMYSWFTHSKWWFSIVFLYVYQRVTGGTLQAFQGNPAGGSWDHEQLHCLEILRQSPSQKPSPKFPIFPNLGLD